MNTINKIIILTLVSALLGCASSADNHNQRSTVIIDPSFDVMNNSPLNTLSVGTVVDFKVADITNGSMIGYITNNIFNVDDNVILFKKGDAVKAKYTQQKTYCGLSGVTMVNAFGDSVPITDFYMMSNGKTFDCNNKKNMVVGGNYSLNITSTSNIPNIEHSISVPDIILQYNSKKLDTSKQYKIVSNSINDWTPLDVVDNGIQSLIVFRSGLGGNHLPQIVINKISLPINSSIKRADGNDYMIVDGVYSSYVINNNPNESYGKVFILRSNTPDTQNVIVDKLYAEKLSLLNMASRSQNIDFIPNSQNTGEANVGLMNVSNGQPVNNSNNVNNSSSPQVFATGSNDPIIQVRNSGQTQSKSGTIPALSGSGGSATLNNNNNNNNNPVYNSSSDNNPIGNMNIMNQLNFGK